MNKRLALLFCCILIIGVAASEACTSAIISARANPYGRPMLWKNRDTDHLDNKVEYLRGKDGSHAYVALFNSEDSLLNEAWMGMNEVGFAIMNTASYNLKDDDLPEGDMDKEGFLMSEALRRCMTVDDFAHMLDTLPRPMGVEANFGVIDAYGNGAYFETNNHSYARFNLSDSPDGVLVRTNYSYSGLDNEGFGFNREANACHLLKPYRDKAEIVPELFTETLSRSFWHDLMKKDFADGEFTWVVDQDFIPRMSSSASIVIEGCKPLAGNEKPTPAMVGSQYVMWTALGYPPCAEVVDVWCRPDGVDSRLVGSLPGGHSQMGDIVMRRKAEVFPLSKGNGEKYVDIRKLFNEEGTGFVQTLVPQNLETYRKVRALRDGIK